jgi:hypothetical protein
MSSSRIHFVVPSRNEPVALLDRTIIALRAASPDASITLVDDCSGPAAAADAKMLAERIPGLRLCRTDPPGGAGRAMAVGIEAVLAAAAASDWICTVEADASVEARALVDGLAGAGDEVDVCFFSRVWQGGTRDYPAGRVGLSRTATLVHRLIRKDGPPDWTLFYRGYRARLLASMRFDAQEGPADFSWQAWMAHRTLDVAAQWIDVPVRFEYRRHAHPMWRRHARHIRSHLRVALQEWRR